MSVMVAGGFFQTKQKSHMVRPVSILVEGWCMKGYDINVQIPKLPFFSENLLVVLRVSVWYVCNVILMA